MSDDDTMEEPVPTPPKPAGLHVNVGSLWDVAQKVLALLVIPLLLWGVKLEVANAQRDIIIVQMKEDIEDLETDLKETEKLEKSINDLALKFVALEGALNATNGRLDDVIVLLRER